MKVRLIGQTVNPEALVEHAGRVCYKSKKKDDPGRFIRARVKEGHESIIEHASLTFEISGISRACSHQIVRHRIASYSQQSMRYVDMSSPEFVIPPDIEEDEEAEALWYEHMETCAHAYRQLREMGIRKEDARFALPIATATRIVVTMNLRSLRHFFSVRCDKAAQWEIRAVAKEMLKLAHGVAPSVFDDQMSQIETNEHNKC